MRNNSTTTFVHNTIYTISIEMELQTERCIQYSRFKIRFDSIFAFDAMIKQQRKQRGKRETRAHTYTHTLTHMATTAAAAAAAAL